MQTPSQMSSPDLSSGLEGKNLEQNINLVWSQMGK